MCDFVSDRGPAWDRDLPMHDSIREICLTSPAAAGFQLQCACLGGIANQDRSLFQGILAWLRHRNGSSCKSICDDPGCFLCTLCGSGSHRSLCLIDVEPLRADGGASSSHWRHQHHARLLLVFTVQICGCTSWDMHQTARDSRVAS